MQQYRKIAKKSKKLSPWGEWQDNQQPDGFVNKIRWVHYEKLFKVILALLKIKLRDNLYKKLKRTRAIK